MIPRHVLAELHAGLKRAEELHELGKDPSVSYYDAALLGYLQVIARATVTALAAQTYDTQPRHRFEGRSDRTCERCGLPDRDEIHTLPGDTRRP